MVRREEQRWRNRATIFLDTRSWSHMGVGPASSFEAAVSAAASVGVHIAREGLTAQFVTDGETLRSGPFFSDALLDELAVIRQSSRRNLDIALAELRTASGVIVAIAGRLSVREARQLAATRTEGSQGLALLLDVTSWADEPHPAGPASSVPADGAPGQVATADGPKPADGQPAASRPSETAAAEAILRSAGWHVSVLGATTPLPLAWQRLSQPPITFVRRPTGDPAEPVPVGGTGDGAAQ
jgi:uncharacterized protein (DUF58 family)